MHVIDSSEQSKNRRDNAHFRSFLPSNPTCEISQNDTEEWINVGTETEVLHMIMDTNLISAA